MSETRTTGLRQRRALRAAAASTLSPWCMVMLETRTKRLRPRRALRAAAAAARRRTCASAPCRRPQARCCCCAAARHASASAWQPAAPAAANFFVQTLASCGCNLSYLSA